jgi:glucose/arabinose dehydrogenase
MNNHASRTAFGGAALAAVLLLSACGSDAGTPASTSPTSSATLSAAPTESQDPDLLQLNESLKETLGEKYSEAWISGNKLHVAVTDKAAEATVTAAGAVAHLAKHSAAELEAAIGKIMAWQREQGGDMATAIHRYIPSGRDGSITLAVDPARLEVMRTGLASDKVTGDIELKFVESAGPASPAASS